MFKYKKHFGKRAMREEGVVWYTSL